MLTANDIENEVAETIEGAIRDGKIAPAAWVTHTVVTSHDAIEGDDFDWYRVCAFTAVRDAVRRCLRRYKPDASVEADAQITLPGFDRLQKAYLVERDEDHVVVPTSQLVREEIVAKISELRIMGAGCFKHADELERYLNERFAA